MKILRTFFLSPSPHLLSFSMNIFNTFVLSFHCDWVDFHSMMTRSILEISRKFYVMFQCNLFYFLNCVTHLCLVCEVFYVTKFNFLLSHSSVSLCIYYFSNDDLFANEFFLFSLYCYLQHDVTFDLSGVTRVRPIKKTLRLGAIAKLR